MNKMNKNSFSTKKSFGFDFIILFSTEINMHLYKKIADITAVWMKDY